MIDKEKLYPVVAYSLGSLLEQIFPSSASYNYDYQDVIYDYTNWMWNDGMCWLAADYIYDTFVDLGYATMPGETVLEWDEAYVDNPDEIFQLCVLNEVAEQCAEAFGPDFNLNFYME